MKYPCLYCDGEVEFIDVDDVTIIVYCPKCDRDYVVEPDGLGCGGLEWADAMTELSFRD